MAKTKKAGKKKPARSAAKSTKAARPAKRPAKPKRLSWLAADAQTPVIERYARQLGSFIDALADGVVDAAEVKAQEKRLVALMKQVEPKLDDAMHAKVTELLCELTAYDLMQVLHAMSGQRPKQVFRG